MASSSSSPWQALQTLQPWQSFQRARQRLGGRTLQAFFEGASQLGQLHPRSRPEAHGVERITNVPYLSSGRVEHLLDVYRPKKAQDGLRPVVFYVHGGAFQILSKDTHWLMGIIFARAGYVVFNINYRLAPEHRFPAGLEDVAAAYQWVLREAPRWGGDPGRIVVAGESAGANLVTSLTIMSCYQRPEPYARRVFDAGVTPKAVLPACGILQVSDTARYWRHKPMPRFFRERFLETELGYLPTTPPNPGGFDLADPLLVLERGEPPHRPLPPFFAPVGLADHLVDDTRRLERALAKLNTRCEARYYPRGVHAFHAFIFLQSARLCWQEKLAFLQECQSSTHW